MRILVTGAAGFIGMHFAKRALQEGHQVLGVDDLNTYYETGLKNARLEQLSPFSGFEFQQIDISESGLLTEAASAFKPEVIVNLAAQAGVRHSIDHPDVYVKSNLVGFANILEVARAHKVKHLVYASSSSVYGSNAASPFRVSDPTDTPISLYAATKKANEGMAHSYAHLYDVPCTGLRFFTVYGPWGRPDMAYYSFTQHILAQTKFKLFNDGDLSRDFTYIDDIVESIFRLIDRPPLREGQNSEIAPNRVLNIGRGEPVHIGSFVKTLSRLLGKPALYDSVGMQPGDMSTTFADTTELEHITGFKPAVSIEEGLQAFVEWYKTYYKL